MAHNNDLSSQLCLTSILYHSSQGLFLSVVCKRPKLMAMVSGFTNDFCHARTEGKKLFSQRLHPTVTTSTLYILLAKKIRQQHSKGELNPRESGLSSHKAEPGTMSYLPNSTQGFYQKRLQRQHSELQCLPWAKCVQR